MSDPWLQCNWYNEMYKTTYKLNKALLLLPLTPQPSMFFMFTFSPFLLFFSYSAFQTLFFSNFLYFLFFVTSLLLYASVFSAHPVPFFYFPLASLLLLSLHRYILFPLSCQIILPLHCLLFFLLSLPSSPSLSFLLCLLSVISSSFVICWFISPLSLFFLFMLPLLLFLLLFYLLYILLPIFLLFFFEFFLLFLSCLLHHLLLIPLCHLHLCSYSASPFSSSPTLLLYPLSSDFVISSSSASSLSFSHSHILFSSEYVVIVIHLFFVLFSSFFFCIPILYLSLLFLCYVQVSIFISQHEKYLDNCY